MSIGWGPWDDTSTASFLSMTDLFMTNNATMDMNMSNSVQTRLKNLLKNKNQEWYRLAFEYANVYLTPFIIFIGTSGNILSFTVFSCTYLKMKSSSVYLAALSIADTGFLLCLFFIWLAKVDVRVFHQPFFCQLFLYLQYVFCFLSVWSVVGFTCERYIFVYHPLIKDRLCTTRTSKGVVCTVSAIACLCYIFAFWTNGSRVTPIDPNKPVCIPLSEYYDIMTVMTSLDLLFAFVIPCALIVVLNIRIMIKLRQYQNQSVIKLKQLKDSKNGSQLQIASRNGHISPKNHNSPRNGHISKRPHVVASISRTGSMHFTFVSRSADMFSESRNAYQNCSTQSHVNSVRKNISQYRTARILLLVSTIFLTLHTPNHIFRLQAFVKGLTEAGPATSSKRQIVWQELFQLVYFLNFGVNFFIYSLCSRTFRNALKRLRQRCKRSKADMHPVIVIHKCE